MPVRPHSALEVGTVNWEDNDPALRPKERPETASVGFRRAVANGLTRPRPLLRRFLPKGRASGVMLVPHAQAGSRYA
jgi:hypothetical protein